MGRLIKLSLTLLLFMLPLTAQIASMPVPAVVSLGEGELVGLNVEIRSGNDEVYVATRPLVGTQTQESARTAFYVATSLVNVSPNYDALISLRPQTSSQSVDGPSAGAAMTVLMLSIFENRSIRSDMTMTGTINDDGSIGQVGAVSEKTKAAVDAGMKVMLIPRISDVFDSMLFSILGRRWNITIIQVDNISQATNLAFSPKNATLQSNVMEVMPGAGVNVSATDAKCIDCHMNEFRGLTDEIINEDENLLGEVRRQNNSDFAYFLDRIQGGIQDAETAENGNYLYTAANSAFLSEISLNFLKDSNITYYEFRNRMSDVEGCIENTRRPEMNTENFEWVAGGDERLAWASKRFGEIMNVNYSSNDDEMVLLMYDELLNAESWCMVSNEMYSIANGINGTPVNENSLKAFAAVKIADANDQLNTFGSTDFGDAEWRFEAAKEEFNESHFTAAIVDSDYLLGTIAALNSSEDFDSFVRDEFGTTKNWNSMWAALYGSQARYVYLSSNSTTTSAIALEEYANLIDGDVMKMRELFKSPGTLQPQAEAGILPSNYDNELALLLVFCIVIAIFLNVIHFFRKPE